MQKRYDVGQEAYIMSTGNAILQMFRKYNYGAGRRYYEKFSHIPSEISYLKELRAIKVSGDTVLAVPDRARVPQELADLAGVEVNGLPKDEEILEFGRQWGGCSKVEEAFPKEWKELNVPAAPAVPPAPASQFSPNPYSRPQPYQPTPQQGDFRYNPTRGNPPGDVCDKDWALAFNRVNFRLLAKYGQDLEKYEAARNDGRTRDNALEELISKCRLSQGFVDDNP